MALRTLSLCAGLGGIDLGLSPWCRTVGLVERDAFAAACLVEGMAQAALDPAPIFDDLRAFDGAAWRGCVDLVVAGYPCQPFSVAGNRSGADDERHLWPEVYRILQETDAPLLFCENVRGHLSLGFADVLADLAAIGFDAEWICVRASDVGAPHERDRLFFLAYCNERGLEAIRRCRLLDRERAAQRDDADGCDSEVADAERSGWIQSERNLPGGERDAAGSSRSAEVADSERAELRDESGLERGASRSGAAEPGDNGATAVAGSAARTSGRDPTVPSRGGLGGCAQTRRPTETVEHAASVGRGQGRTESTGDEGRRTAGGSGIEVGHANGTRLPQRGRDGLPGLTAAWPPGPDDADGWREWLEQGGPAPTQPAVRRGSARAAVLVDSLRCLGNAVVPAQAALAFETLASRITDA